MPITIIDAEGRAKEVRNRLRAFGAQHPFTLATATLIVGFLLGLVVG
jgi:hypothetical protein